MIAPDTNILIYAHDVDSPYHAFCRRWLEDTLNRRDEIGLCWPVVIAYLRITTNPVAFGRRLTMREALNSMDSILSRSHVTMMEAGPKHWKIMQDLIAKGQVQRDMVMDAHIAALAIEHGATLCTNDRDFMRFPGLRILNPIARA